MADHIIRVGVCWETLAQQPDQLRRIAETSGAAPVVWSEATPEGDKAEIEVLIASDVPETVPAETPRLRLLQTPSAGIEWLQDHPVWKSDVMLASSSGVHGVQIGEHVLMLLLALRRHLPQYLSAQRRHLWRHEATGDQGVALMPGELYGKTLGLIGYGHIGRGVAHLARAFGMRVLAITASTRKTEPLSIPDAGPFVDLPAVPPPDLAPDERWPLDRLYDLLAQSDAIVICAPLTPQTEGLIDEEALKHVKPDACLVNIARGKIVEEDALIGALREGRLAGAGLDVTAEEPLPTNSPLWEMPNVIITPHISGMSERYVERAVNILLANIECLRRGELPITLVNRAKGY